jgi:putrescine transport system ATP-binding protein
MAALDKKLRRDTQLELVDIQKRLGTTFVIVTHDQEEAMTVASRIAIMDHGELVQVATPIETYENPVSRHVAQFVGDTNLFEGRATPGPDGLCNFSVTSTEDVFRVPAAKPAASATTHYLNIRPEKMDVTTDRPQDGSNAVYGSIVDIAYLGNISTYYVELPGGKVISAQVTNSQRLQKATFQLKDAVWVSWYAVDGLLLDR